MCRKNNAGRLPSRWHSESVDMREFNLKQAVCGSVKLMVVVTCAAMVGVTGAATAEELLASGQEFSILGQLPGDQMNASADMLDGRGYMVWQDNLTDGEGSGISAVGLTAGGTPTTGAFRVNAKGADEQENPDVSMLSGGGAVFVWQSGVTGRQEIVFRVMDENGVFISGDQRVSTAPLGHQQGARLASLNDGGFVVTWTEYDDTGSEGQRHNDVYFQRFASDGSPQGGKTRVNQRTAFNQRSSEVILLSDGRLAFTWISETLRGYVDASSGAASLDPTIGGLTYWVDVHSRYFSGTGEPLGSEFFVNESEKISAHPTIGEFGNGRLIYAWSSNAGFDSAERWDIAVRITDLVGRPITSETTINSPDGDQIAPSLAVVEETAMVVWTSRRGDNRSDEVQGISVNADGLVSEEFAVNSTSYHSQLSPAVFADGDSIVAAWSGFDNSAKSFELYAQRYSAAPNSLPTPSAPFLTSLSGSKVEVSWNPVGGLDIDAYLLFLQGSSTPVEVTGESHIAGGFASGSTVAVRIAYRITSGQVSEPSATTVTTTWGEDSNLNGLPDDWETSYWGDNESLWPGGNVDSDGDGEINRNEFLAGTNPTNADDVLRIWLSNSEQGIWANWPTTPGRFYKLQVSRDLVEWLDYTDYRFAPGAQDSVLMDSTENTLYFRVLLRR